MCNVGVTSLIRPGILPSAAIYKKALFLPSISEVFSLYCQPCGSLELAPFNSVEDKPNIWPTPAPLSDFNAGILISRKKSGDNHEADITATAISAPVTATVDQTFTWLMGMMFP